MKKITTVLLIYLISLVLLVPCSRIEQLENVQEHFKESSSCVNPLVQDLAYSHEEFAEKVMNCNILKLQSLQASVRKIKGQRRAEIVYLNVKCDEISKMLLEYEKQCKK